MTQQNIDFQTPLSALTLTIPPVPLFEVLRLEKCNFADLFRRVAEGPP